MRKHTFSSATEKLSWENDEEKGNSLSVCTERKQKKGMEGGTSEMQYGA